MQKPTRILYLDHTARLSGGELALSRLLVALDKERIEPVVVLAEEGPLAATLRSEGIETHVFPLAEQIRFARKDKLGWLGWLNRASQVLPLLQYAHELARFAQENQIELIYTNSLKADFYGALAGRLANLPVIWHVRDRIEESYLPKAAVRLVRLLARRLPTCVVANSQSTLETLQLPKEKTVEVISSGLTPAYIQRCLESRTENTIPQVGIIGRIADWKGQDIFIQAAAQLLKSGIKAQFRIVGAPLFGEDEHLVRLKKLVSDLGIDESVTFLGFQDDIPAQLRKLDVLVHASVTPEPFGQVIVEGMVAGVPVIATNAGGAREIVTHEKTGLLVPMGDVDALAQSLTTLLENPQYAQQLAAAGREHVLQNYTIELSARKSESLYARVLRQRSTGKVELAASLQQGVCCLLAAVLSEILSLGNLQIFQ